jgi:signal transduction histidine kinase
MAARGVGRRIRTRLDWLLSLGHFDGVPHLLARQVRVTNALALLGAMLSFASTPIDAWGGIPLLAAYDAFGTIAFATVWWLNARRRPTAARVLLLCAANLEIVTGAAMSGNVEEVRSVFFPLVLLPFLVFGLRERGWLAVFIAVPIGCYFATSQLSPPVPSAALSIYMIYAPLLAFTMIIGGVSLFAYIDVQVHKKLLEARERAAQDARLVALGEMSSGIAHEIRNPLAAIHLAATQLVEHPEDGAHVGELGERIQRIVKRASRIIDSLRSFARDASNDPFVEAPVDRIVGDALELCGRRFTDHGIALAVATVPAELVVECRPVQITQVLVNLLSNAFDAVASAPERRVQIEVSVDDDALTIAVIDSGSGIDPATRAHLFEPFFTTKPPDRGTGLGLSLSRRIVEAHHGTLELDDAAPSTRFVMRIPRAQRPV